MTSYSVISADNHIIEAPNCFVDHVPAAFKDRAPRIVRGDDGGDGWSFDGRATSTFGLNAVAGRPFKDYKAKGLTFEEILPGNYDGAAHIEDMRKDGVDAAVIFPYYGLQTYIVEDREFGLVLMRAYNDWLIEDFCSAGPDRLIALALLPVDDGMEATTAEFERVVAKGAKAVFVPYFAKKPFHDRYYDPLWKLAADASIPVHIHRTMGGKAPSEAQSTPSPEAEAGLNIAGMVQRYFTGVTPFTNMVFTGVFERFPTLKFVDAEVNGGWLPFWLQMMQQVFDRQRHWANAPLKTDPRELLGRNLFVSVLDDYLYFEQAKSDPVIASAGMFSTDYPHSTTLFPHTQEYIAKLSVGMDAETKHQILAGNAQRVYNL